MKKNTISKEWFKHTGYNISLPKLHRFFSVFFFNSTGITHPLPMLNSDLCTKNGFKTDKGPQKNRRIIFLVSFIVSYSRFVFVWMLFFFHSKFPHIVQWIVVCWWWWLHVYACVHFFFSSSSYFEISCDVGNTVAECRTQTPFVMAIHFLRQQVLILKSDKMKWKRNKIKTNNELKMKYKMKITQHITKLKERRSWAVKEKNGAKEIW